MKFVRARSVKRGEWQNDVTHYQFHRHAVEQPTHQRMLRQENQPAACPGVNSPRRRSDKKVQGDTKNIGAGPSLQSLPPQQASGDHERNLRSKQDASLREIQTPGNQAARRDRRESIPFSRWPTRGISTHRKPSHPTDWFAKIWFAKTSEPSLTAAPPDRLPSTRSSLPSLRHLKSRC